MGGDEIEESDNESFDLEKYWSNKEETAKNFKIETNIFNYVTPLCLAFNEFNYLLKVDSDLLTKDIIGFKTYEDYKNDWIYDGTRMYHACVTSRGLIMEYGRSQHHGGNLSGAYHIGNSLHYQNLEWYEALEDNDLKE
nr:hypothetical protein [Tanacetum cinerariifolium]